MLILREFIVTVDLSVEQAGNAIEWGSDKTYRDDLWSENSECDI